MQANAHQVIYRIATNANKRGKGQGGRYVEKHKKLTIDTTLELIQTEYRQIRKVHW